MENNQANAESNANANTEQNSQNNANANAEGNEEVTTLKSQLEAQRRQNKELEGKISTFSKQLDDLKKNGLKAKEDYKALYEQAEKEKQDLATDNEKKTKSFFNTMRFLTVKDEAQKLGIRTEAMPDLSSLDMSELEVKMADDGLIRVSGAKEWAEKAKKLKPHWFKAANDPVINAGGTGTGATGKPSREEFNKAFTNRQKDPAAYRKVLERMQPQKT